MVKTFVGAGRRPAKPLILARPAPALEVHHSGGAGGIRAAVELLAPPFLRRSRWRKSAGAGRHPADCAGAAGLPSYLAPIPSDHQLISQHLRRKWPGRRQAAAISTWWAAAQPAVGADTAAPARRARCYFNIKMSS